MGAKQSRAGIAEPVDAIRRIVRALRESAREAQRRTGVSGAQLFVLQQLRDGGSCSLGEIAHRTLTHPSSVSVVVQRLVDAGLVSRERSREDARRVEVALTARGNKVARKMPRLFQEQLISAVAALPPARRRALTAGLTALVHELGLSEVEAHMFFEEKQK